MTHDDYVIEIFKFAQHRFEVFMPSTNMFTRSYDNDGIVVQDISNILIYYPLYDTFIVDEEKCLARGTLGGMDCAFTNQFFDYGINNEYMVLMKIEYKSEWKIYEERTVTFTDKAKIEFEDKIRDFLKL